MDGPGKRSELFLSNLLLLQHTINMTLSTSLTINGRQLGCSESVISHCSLCPLELSTEFCIGGRGGAMGGIVMRGLI